MENFFKLKEHNTDVKTEVFAGITTFISMVYILAVNPSILSAAGMNPASVFTATCVASAAATFFMAFFANYPIALSSGMGLNAYFAYTVCGELAKAGIQDPWKVALTAVLVEGIIFILLSLVKFRETLVNEVPMNLKLGITVGIGSFIAIIGLKNAGVVIANPITLVDMGSVVKPQPILALIGFLVIVILHHYRVKGDILVGILVTWFLGMVAQKIGWYVIDIKAEAFDVFPDFAHGFVPATPNLFAFDFSYIANNFTNFAIIVFSFLFVDLFDTVGTLIGIAHKADMLDENGRLPKVGGALMADALGTTVGACLGTSTVTSYIESSAGVAQGGRTGLTSVTTAVLFLVALVLSPIFIAIPAFAVTPALLFVGFLMMSTVAKMDFHTDMADAVGGFLAIIMMPFTFSIANGIMFGIVSYVLIRIFQGRLRDIHIVMGISFIIFGLRILVMVLQQLGKL